MFYITRGKHFFNWILPHGNGNDWCWVSDREDAFPLPTKEVAEKFCVLRFGRNWMNRGIKILEGEN